MQSMRRTRRSTTLGQFGPMALVLLAALDLRVLAAVGVQRFVDRHDAYRLCVFPDARYYWLLALTIPRRAPMKSWSGSTSRTGRCALPVIRCSWRPARRSSASCRWRSGWSRPSWGLRACGWSTAWPDALTRVRSPIQPPNADPGPCP